MKKLQFIACAVIGIAALAAFAAEGPEPAGGRTVKTQTSLSAEDRDVLLAKLGLTITGSSLNVALTGSTGLIIKSGTVTTY